MCMKAYRAVSAIQMVGCQHGHTLPPGKSVSPTPWEHLRWGIGIRRQTAKTVASRALSGLATFLLRIYRKSLCRPRERDRNS